MAPKSMKTAFMLAWRSLASRPARSFTAVLGIGLGIATVLAIQVVDHNTLLTQARAGADAVQPDVEIQPVQSGVPAGGATPDALDQEPALQAYCALFFNRAEGRIEGSEDGQQLQLCGLGPNAAGAFDIYRVDAGRDFSTPDAREALLSRKTALDLGIGIGDPILLRRVTPVREGCVNGELVKVKPKIGPGETVAFTVVGLLAPHNLGQRRIVLTPFESGAELFAGAPLHPLYWGKLGPDAVFQDVRERLKASFVVEKPKLAMVGERIDQRAFRKSIRITSLLSLLLGLFVIYNAFSMALVERVREIGLLRAMGMTRGEIMSAVLVEGSVLAFLGCVAGLLLTVVVVWFMHQFQITTLGQGKPLDILEVPWTTTAGILLFGASFALFGMAAPLLRARHLSVVEALRAGRLALRSDPGFALRVAVLVGVPVLIPLFYMMATPPLGERQNDVLIAVLKVALVVGTFFGVVLLLPGLLHRVVELCLWPLRALYPIEVPLCRAAIRGSRLRVLATLTGLAVVVASIFCIREVNEGFLREMAAFSDRAMDGRVYLQTRPLARERAETLEAVEGIAHVDSLSAEILSPFPIRGVSLEHAAEKIPLLRTEPQVREDFAAGRSLILSQFLADSFGYRVGDEVNLSTFSGARSLRVGAIADTYGYFPDDRAFALLEAGRMESLFCVNDQDGTRYVAQLEAGADRDAVIRACEAALGDGRALWIRSDAEIKQLYLTDRRRDFWVFDVILWLIAALATIGLLNSLTIAIMERRRELGLLRTIGLTPGQIGRLLLLESMAVGLVGGLIAAAVTVPLAHFTLEGVRVISRLELFFEFRHTSWVYPLLSGLLIALVASVWPAFRSRRLPLAALARYE